MFMIDYTKKTLYMKLEKMKIEINYCAHFNHLQIEINIKKFNQNIMR